MVFFTCNACGESMRKNQVEKHYKFKCRNCQSLSCVDCNQEFWGDDYAKHTKCISEDVKYGGKDYKPKPNANKGEKKQEEWIELVQSAVDRCTANPKLKQLLEKLKDYSNIPRKKPKFENFVRNSLRINVTMATQMWDAISTETERLKTNNQADKGSNPNTSNGDVQQTEETSTDSDTPNHQNEPEHSKKLSKREKKEMRSKKQTKVQKKDKVIGNGVETEENVDGEPSKKKKKKRKMSEEVENMQVDGAEEDIESPKKKKKRKHNSNHEQEENGQDEEEKPKKKKKKENKENENAMNESLNNSTEDQSEINDEVKAKGKFQWEDIIIQLLKKADGHQLPVKKLKKKVIAEYCAFNSDSPYKEEKALVKFNKKLNNPRFKVHKEKVTLKS